VAMLRQLGGKAHTDEVRLLHYALTLASTWDDGAALFGGACCGAAVSSCPEIRLAGPSGYCLVGIAGAPGGPVGPHSPFFIDGPGLAGG